MIPLGRIWIPRESGKYWLPKQRFLTVYHHCLQYPEWKVEINVLRASLGIGGVNYDGMPHGNGISDPTSSAAIRLADLAAKMKQLEDTVRDAAPDIYRWLLQGVTEDRPFWYLHDQEGMPLERDAYYERRRRFYYLMAQKL